MNERLLRLEEKVAYLERHVTEQDKAMLELADEVARLRAEVKLYRDRMRSGAEGGSDELPDERPPHY